MVSYQFYSDEYHGGAISAMEWPAAEREASVTLNRYKRDFTVTGTEDQERMAVCAMAEVMVQNATTSSDVSSASIGSVHVSYQQKAPAEQERDVYTAARQYLDIYRGVG